MINLRALASFKWFLYTARTAAEKKYDPGDCRFAPAILLDTGFIADAEGVRDVSIEHIWSAHLYELIYPRKIKFLTTISAVQFTRKTGLWSVLDLSSTLEDSERQTILHR